MAETLTREFGHLNGMLHNAATLGTLTPLEHYNVQEWYRVLQVNLTARFLLTQACMGLLKAADDASVVFTSADVGRHARAYWGAYAVSNFGNEALMQLLADECEVNTAVRVNSVDPGAVLTQMRRAAYPAEDPTTLPVPEVVLPTYLYLMGPDSRGVTGEAFNAQG